MSQFPSLRLRVLNDKAVNADGEFVLYWMTMNRRTRYNFSLERAVEHAQQLDKPLVVFEALRVGYRWASDRLHRFVLQGMADNRASLEDTPALYYPYVEPHSRDGAGLLDALADRACVIVTDDFPCFFIPKMLRYVAPRLPVSLEAIDSNGLLPMRAADKVFARAYDFRRFLQKTLPDHIDDTPAANPLARRKLAELKALPREITDRWPAATDALLQGDVESLSQLPIDHDVGPAVFDGGMHQAELALRRFLDSRLENYSDDRSKPEEAATSELSPYLHFGHISVHDVFNRLTNEENWSSAKVQDRKATGSRDGWWQMSPAAESFLDELVTWREVGFNMCWQRDDYDRYESLPDWAQETLAEHESDKRPYVYSLEELEQSQTHDELWNAAQTQLVLEGRMHNYLRMLWGKKILEWSPTPKEALKTLIELNNKYAVDGRNPNSYSGIFWCLGRYDRAWGPEREIFGKIRYMSSDNTARKFRVKDYIRKYNRAAKEQSLFPD